MYMITMTTIMTACQASSTRTARAAVLPTMSILLLLIIMIIITIMNVCVCACACTCTCICTCICICVCVRVCVYIYIHTCIYVYTYIYIYTHIRAEKTTRTRTLTSLVKQSAGKESFGQKVVNLSVIFDATLYEPSHVKHTACGCNALLPLPACPLPLTFACLSALVFTIDSSHADRLLFSEALQGFSAKAARACQASPW